MTDKFAAIREAEKKATKGPWNCDDDGLWFDHYAMDDEAQNGINFAFIAIAREAVPALLAEVDRLKGLVDHAAGYAIKLEQEQARLDGIIKGLEAENKRMKEACRQIVQFEGQADLYDIRKNGNLATAVEIARAALQEKQP